MRVRAALVLLAAAAFPAAAEACGTALPVPPPAGRLIAEQEGLGLAAAGGALVLVALAEGTKLNAAAGIAIGLRDGRECHPAMGAEDRRAVRIGLPPGRVAHVEAAICDAAEGSCLPVRIDLPR